MSKNIMSKNTEVVTVKALLRRDDYQNRFKEILGQRAAQFSASVVNISRDKDIAECDPASVIAAAVVAATLDLPVDRNLGFAWIIPYKEKGLPVAQFQMGYKGYVQLALRTGQYERMNASAINAEAYGGRDSVGEPIILWEKVDVAKPTIGYAFAWKLVTGFTKVCYWPKERVESHARQYSQSYRGSYSSPWKTHFDQMAIKTVIKNELSDWGILSVELQKALRHDQGTQMDIESEVVYTDNPPEPKKADLSDIKMAISGIENPGEPPQNAPETIQATTKPPAKKNAPDEAQTPGNATPEGGQTASPQDEGKAALDDLSAIMEKFELTIDQVLAFCVKNSLAKKGQKLTELATSKLKNLAKAIKNPDGKVLAEIKNCCLGQRGASD